MSSRKRRRSESNNDSLHSFYNLKTGSSLDVGMVPYDGEHDYGNNSKERITGALTFFMPFDFNIEHDNWSITDLEQI